MTRMIVVTEYDFVHFGGHWHAQIPWDSDRSSLYWPEISHIVLVGTRRPAEGLMLDRWHPVDPSLAVEALPPFSFSPLRLIRRARSLARLLRRSDVIMLKMFYPSSVLAYAIARLIRGGPVATVLVGDPERAFLLREDLVPNAFLRRLGSRLAGWVTRAIVNGSDVACFVSQALKRAYWNGRTACIVANESWLKPCDYLPSRRLATPLRSLLYIGRLSGPKGLHVLLEAFKAMRAEVPDMRLTIAGDGPLRQDVLAAAATVSGIQYVGWVKGQSAGLYELLRSHDVLVLPSLNEGLPLVLLEAMANRAIVCSTDVGGVPEIVEDGTSGFLFKPGAVSELCLALRRVFRADTAFLDAVADAAYKVAEQSSYANQRGALAEAVKDLIRGLHQPSQPPHPPPFLRSP